MPGTHASTGIPPWIRLWFAVDAILFLFPPIYWATSSVKTEISNLPVNLLYFILGCTCITSSVVAAYIFDPMHREPSR